jgi:hypothetical protein
MICGLCPLKEVNESFSEVKGLITVIKMANRKKLVLGPYSFHRGQRAMP